MPWGRPALAMLPMEGGHEINSANHAPVHHPIDGAPGAVMGVLRGMELVASGLPLTSPPCSSSQRPSTSALTSRRCQCPRWAAWRSRRCRIPQ